MNTFIVVLLAALGNWKKLAEVIGLGNSSGFLFGLNVGTFVVLFQALVVKAALKKQYTPTKDTPQDMIAKTKTRKGKIFGYFLTVEVTLGIYAEALIAAVAPFAVAANCPAFFGKIVPTVLTLFVALYTFNLAWDVAVYGKFDANKGENEKKIVKNKEAAKKYQEFDKAFDTGVAMAFEFAQECFG